VVFRGGGGAPVNGGGLAQFLKDGMVEREVGLIGINERWPVEGAEKIRRRWWRIWHEERRSDDRGGEDVVKVMWGCCWARWRRGGSSGAQGRKKFCRGVAGGF
jgi:hypothetical protein